jgi:hypothetical protein
MGIGRALAAAARVVAAATLSTTLATGLAAQAGPVEPASTSVAADEPPPSTGGFFPLSELKRGMMATAWTVFSGTRPEPMQVEILGVLHGGRGPGQDMILAQLHGAKPEYTGVVAGMSGSPVYIGNRLVGSLSYRIGQFSKDPIAGITPIEQMLQVREQGSGVGEQGSGVEGSGVGDQATPKNTGGMEFQAMETPLSMPGFRPEAIELWRKQMAGTGLDLVAAGGMANSVAMAVGSSSGVSAKTGAPITSEPSASAIASMRPGSAVSAQLVRGDLEIAATCTVTYIDPKELLACGHPLLQSGHVSLPMTSTEVVATLASPLNAFKIINTGALIGTFTEDRDSALRGELGARPHMIPMHISVHSTLGARKLNVEILDLPSLTTQAMMVSLFEILTETNESTAQTSYHVTGHVDLEGHEPSPIEVWTSGGDAPATLETALLAGERFGKIYMNPGRTSAVRGIELQVEAIPHRVHVELEAAHLVSSDIVHAGDTVMVEATVRPWQEPARNIRIPVKVPARIEAGTLRILVSDAGTLDRTLDQPRQTTHTADLDSVLADAKRKHAADRIWVSLLVPETQAGMDGHTLTSLPLSVANALEPLRTAQDVSLNGESAQTSADAPAGGVLSGFQVLSVRVDPGGGLN